MEVEIQVAQEVEVEAITHRIKVAALELQDKEIMVALAAQMELAAAAVVKVVEAVRLWFIQVMLVEMD
jgi:uncharacterized Fe-S cluster-containing protein